VLAYLSWHCPASGVEVEAYERALAEFHRSLAHSVPSGFRGSASFRAPQLPWLAPAFTPGEVVGQASAASAYEDWYLLEDWAALGVLEEAAVSHAHVSSHDKVASLSGASTSAVYRFIEGHAGLDQAQVTVWVARAGGGYEHPSLSALLGDGMDPALDGLWRRCLGLGPAPEFCLLGSEAAAGVAPSRLPQGWSATTLPRETLWRG
jgi:hypothetical protein